MPDQIGAGYWRSRAEETRALAKQMRDPTVKKTLEGIADDYDKLADQAEVSRKPAEP